MDDGVDSRRRPGFDDEADGLDCFATEGVVVIDTADDAGALVETRAGLPAVRTAAPIAALIVGRAAQDAWQQWTHGSWLRRFVVASALLAFGVLTLWVIEPVDQPRIVADKPAPPASVVAPQAQPAPPIARPVPEPAVARAVEPSRTTTAPAATARTITPVAPAPSARRPSVPLGTPEAPPATTSEVVARPLGPAPAPAPAFVVATPEVVRAEPAEAPRAAASAAVIVPPTDRSSIERVLQAYREAYDRLDAPSAAVIWPRVDTRALSRAFSTLAEQDVSFDRCDLDIAGVKANAKCTGEIRYVRRVGDQVPRTRKLSWQFALERVSDRWQIAQVTAN